MATERKRPDEVLEAEAGGQYHRALLLLEAQVACEHLYEEFAYDDTFPVELRNALRTVIDTEVLV